jgi:hypothetical protein
MMGTAGTCQSVVAASKVRLSPCRSDDAYYETMTWQRRLENLEFENKPNME